MPHRWHRVALALIVGAATLVAASTAWATDVQSAKRDAASFFDARTTVAAKKELRAKAAKLDAARSAAVDGLRTALGPQGVVSIDPLTSTRGRSAVRTTS